jgi:orotidine-5'-phosphate decarboxylase
LKYQCCFRYSPLGLKDQKKGIFVLVKTSNPSSGEFQDKLIDGKPLYELVGEHVAKWGEDCVGELNS